MKVVSTMVGDQQKRLRVSCLRRALCALYDNTGAAAKDG